MTALLPEDQYESGLTRLPSWFRQAVPDQTKVREMKGLLRDGHLHTVCESAFCPNMGKCWGRGVATFMILGEVCTRACRFCGVKAGRPQTLDVHEPRHVAEAVQALKLRYVVITSVARDDLPDEGAEQFIATIREIRSLTPGVKIEVLIPDFSARAECLKALCDVAPEVVSHNIETVRRLAPEIRPQAQHDRSLTVLRMMRELNPQVFVKSGFMVGLGETDDEIEELMHELLHSGCQILTIGQYLAPTRRKRHVKVQRFLTPQQFDYLRQLGLSLGFKYVMSGPLVRSSYIAEEGYRECLRALQMSPV